MPSFDATLEADETEVRNAIDQTNKEITTRFDFKGSSAKIEQREHELTCHADSDFQLGQVRDVLLESAQSEVSTFGSLTWATSRRSAGIG